MPKSRPNSTAGLPPSPFDSPAGTPVSVADVSPALPAADQAPPTEAKAPPAAETPASRGNVTLVVPAAPKPAEAASTAEEGPRPLPWMQNTGTGTGPLQKGEAKSPWTAQSASKAPQAAPAPKPPAAEAAQPAPAPPAPSARALEEAPAPPWLGASLQEAIPTREAVLVQPEPQTKAQPPAIFSPGEKSLKALDQRQALAEQVTFSVQALNSEIGRLREQMDGEYRALAEALQADAPVSRVMLITQSIQGVAQQANANSELWSHAKALRDAADHYMQMLQALSGEA